MINNKLQLINLLIKIGRIFYGISIIAFGVQQLIIKDFRPEILPPFPAWAHKYVVFPYITGIALIVAGIIICGLFQIKTISTKNVCTCVGFYFLTLIVFCHLPYILILSPNKAYHLGVWAETLKALAFAGGAFVMAGSFSKNNAAKNKNSDKFFVEKFIVMGRIFFATTMVLFGYAHFLYTSYVSAMVPKWFGEPVFWTYFGGAALICSGVAIIFKIFIKQISFLLAAMLFLWFIFLHVPGAIRSPYTDNGNEIVSAFDALLFCGTALIIGLSNMQQKTYQAKE